MSYNLANQMTAANGFSFTYDGFNRRVKSAKSGSTAYYHYSQDGKLLFSESNGVWKNYIYIGSRLIAKDSSSSTSFIHTDILGSTTAQSNNSGTLINNSRRHYKPFGDTYETASNEIGYAGHKFDSELGLSYMQARYYDPVIGRFYSNDPVGWTPKNPVMSFNRYLYVNNNPYKYTDPNGEFLNFAIGAIVGAAVEIGTQVLTEGKVNNWTKVGAMTVAGGVSSGLSIATKGLTVGQKVLATAGNQTIETSSAATASLISDGLTGDHAGSLERAGDTALDTTTGAGKMTVRAGKTKLGALSNAVGLKAPSPNTGSKTLDAALNRGGEALQKAAEGTAASVINTELREDK